MNVKDTKKPTAHIENWFQRGDRLIGTITKHERQNEFKGNTQITSPIVKMDEAAGICETRNTLYTLGKKI